MVGTPGRIKALVNQGSLKLGDLKVFILDECDKMLDELGEAASPRHSTTPSPRQRAPCDLRAWQTCVGTCKKSSSRPRTPSK